MKSISMLPNEHWYGGLVVTGEIQPFHSESVYRMDMTINPSPNQSMPLFVSDMGRYIWRDTGFCADFNKGVITVDADDIQLSEGHESLKGAYLAAMKEHFPVHKITLDPLLFSRPQYNSWIELTYFQSQDKIMEYANSILEHGFKPGVLMIDDGWTNFYGDWQFAVDKFPNPEDMLRKLKEMGFSVMVWVCPFITPDTLTYREARDKGLLIQTADGRPYICDWWNGFSAVLDFSNPEAVEWFDAQLQKLVKMGVDGFKFDAGDSYFYAGNLKTHGNVNADEQCRLWAEFGERYELNEYRASFGAGGYSLMQRLCDKLHSWGDNGLATLLPHTLVQGVMGYAFSCPDMIGGGSFTQFWEAVDSGLDQELFCRHSETACMLPAMQFSASPWRVLDEKHYNLVKKSVAVRDKYIDTIVAEVDAARISGEPIVRYMEYAFPHQGMSRIIDQFMLGDKLLVAPIMEKGCTSRKITIPAGSWRMGDETINSTGETFTLTPPEGEPIVLERCN